MATNFSELKDELVAWVDRPEIEPVLNTFIRLAEADFDRRLRHPQMHKRVDLSLSSQYVSLPADWLETVRLNIKSPSQRIELVSDGALADLRAMRADTTGRPTHYAHTAGGLELFPTPSSAVTAELVYVSSVPKLSDAQPTNWLLTAAPDLYLYGSLMQVVPYVEQDPRVGTWSGLYEAALSALNGAGDRSKDSGSGLRMRFRGL